MNLASEAARLSTLIDKGVAELTKTSVEVAHAEHDYRLARAMAWPKTEGTAKEREDQVQAITAPERLQRDLAEGRRVAALEALRSRRAQLSALQSVANAERAEAEFARTGPRMTP
jgi:predicted alpha/beta-hydrolase family hydrolase